MPLEAKPLFRPDVLAPRLTAFTLPAEVAAARPKLANWAELLASGKAEKRKETELLPDFLTDIFGALLGFAGPAAGGNRWTLSREKHVQVGGKFADAVLGNFRHDKQGDEFIAAVEGKGPRDPLDRPFAGRNKSAVEQAYQYAINLPCDWVIVTSIRQTRLYFKGADQQTYEPFDTEQLAKDDALLRKFVFLLGPPRMAPADGPCHLYDLRTESERVGRALTKEYYLRYADMRQDAFEHLCKENPDVPRPDVLAATQKLLDRVLFCAFSEDRGLLPVDTILRAYEHSDPYHPRPIWENFRGLFAAINTGRPALDIPAYNGGLFADDPLLNELRVPDEVCAYFRDLGDYDYRPAHEVAAEGDGAGHGSLIDVDILGHIFEQSITDLEQLREDLADAALDSARHKSRRKKEGAFYTPAFITRYLVEQALGAVLRERFERLRQTHAAGVRGVARTALEDPSAYELGKLNKKQEETLIGFWQAWQDELKTVRLLDPACGSGAFLIEAFDQMHKAYQTTNDRLAELRGGYRELFDPDREILQHNLYGVDLNEEAVEICRLSLWVKTAARGKQLTSLDHNIRVGNSVVSDPAVHPRALDWQAAFPEVVAAGGFDVVVGNPPYVRQELLSSIKPYLESAYKAYHGMADLYVYFYELGLRLLKPGGRLSFIVTNKWMKAGYGEPLRRFFSEDAWIESVVDFGHAKQIFEDADVFPCIIVARKPTDGPKPEKARLCAIPRDQLRIDDLSEQIRTQGTEIPRARFASEAWMLEPAGLSDLFAKMAEAGIPLAEYAKAKPLFGVKTGYMEAYVLDSAARQAIISADPQAESLIKPFLRGQDIKRWSPNWRGLWLILLKSSSNATWPWSGLELDAAEKRFERSFPGLHAHFKGHEKKLRSRSDQGTYWWELRTCSYYDVFETAKLMWQDLGYHSSFCLTPPNLVTETTCFCLRSDDPWLLAVLNSAVMWSWLWRNTIHGKDEVLRLKSIYTEQIPVPQPRDDRKQIAEASVARLIEITKARQGTTSGLLDWLRIEHEIEKPTLKLQAPLDLDSDALIAEVKKIRGKKKPLTAAALKSLRDEYASTIEPARKLAAEALALEHQVSDLVNEAYGLTPEEIRLLWHTAPPRMPIPRPTGYVKVSK